MFLYISFYILNLILLVPIIYIISILFVNWKKKQKKITRACFSALGLNSTYKKIFINLLLIRFSNWNVEIQYNTYVWTNHMGHLVEICVIGWDLCEPTIWVIWCNTIQYSIPIALKLLMTYNILTDPCKDEYLLWTMLEWFSPLAWWCMKLKQILDIERQRGISEDHIRKLVYIVIIHRPMEQGQLWSRNEAQM